MAVSRASIAAATTSRGARSPIGWTPSVTELPCRSISIAPSPRTASVISGRRPPALTVEQHRRVELDELEVADGQAGPHANATPSPVEPSGFVVAEYRWPSPPVARITDGACTTPSPSSLSTSTPVTAPSLVKHLQRNVIAPDVEQGRGIVERPLHLGARRVAAGVDDPPSRVAALAGQRPLSRRRLVETCSVVDQFGDRAIVRRPRSNAPHPDRTTRLPRPQCRRRAGRSSRRCRAVRPRSHPARRTSRSRRPC